MNDHVKRRNHKFVWKGFDVPGATFEVLKAAFKNLSLFRAWYFGEMLGRIQRHNAAKTALQFTLRTASLASSICGGRTCKA